MTELVPFACPAHGWVLDTFPTARVWHSCGRQAKPAEHVLAMLKRRRQAERRSRNKGPGQRLANSRI